VQALLDAPGRIDWSGANLRNAYLRDADLRNADLQGAYLSGVIGYVP
jgi:uncharacterized protein YjbI with pentapeptide repeats